jgi:hypothetical protein
VQAHERVIAATFSARDDEPAAALPDLEDMESG